MLSKKNKVATGAGSAQSTRLDTWIRWLSYAFLFVFAVCSVRYQYLLLNYREWGDESETIVAVKMMATGLKLYSEIFNHHGPLVFLPGLLLEQFVQASIQHYRVLIALLQIGAVYALYKAPIYRSTSQRVVATVLAVMVILVFLPNVYGHMYKYQSMAGLFLVIILSQYTLPAILCPDKLTTARVVWGNALLVALPFLAVTYLPIAGLLFLASLRRSYIKNSAIGVGLSLLVNLLFLGLFGSFAGFVAFHLYLNLRILPFYSDQMPGLTLIAETLNLLVSNFGLFLSLLLVFFSTTRLAKQESNWPWRTGLLIAGLCSLLVRGAEFQGMPYYYALLPLLALSITSLETDSRSSRFVMLCFLVLLCLKVSLVLPGNSEHLKSQPIPVDSEFSRLATQLTEPDEKIIAYSFLNVEYLLANRLPASGHFFYLPWQEQYNKHPKLGIAINACQQIKDEAPNVMQINKWRVWEKFPWESYAGCVQNVIDQHYTQVPHKDYYIRNEVVAQMDPRFFTQAETPYPTGASAILDEGVSTIPLLTDPVLMGADNTKKLVRLGVILNKHTRAKTGAAQLQLHTVNGDIWSTDIALADVKNQKYNYFDLPPDVYVGGQINRLTAGGISTLESHVDEDTVLTCLNYQYDDGTQAFTPGCLMY